jgi:hypothetical protein
MKNQNRLYWLKKEIEQLECQIKQLTVLSASAMSGMPSSGKVSSPVEKYVLKLDGLQQKLIQRRNEFATEAERIEDEIENISDAEIRLIARKRYLEHKDYQIIGDEMFMDRTTVAKKLKRYWEGKRNGL